MQYKIIKSGFSEEDLNNYSRFLSSSFLSIKYLNIARCTPQYLKWQYLDNPIGHFIGYDAYCNNQIVSHWATLPVLYNIKGIPTKGLLALNLVTHPDHRGKGLFLKIANKTFEDAYNMGYKFVIGVANQNSSHGLINRLGFNLIAPLDVKIGVGGIIVGKTDDCQLQSIWDADTLKWRLSNPSAQYYINNSNFIVTSTGKPLIYSQLHYQESSYNTSSLNIDNRNSLFKLWIGISQNKTKKGFFLNLPKKLKPVPLNLIIKDLTSNNLKFKKEDVFFELIDFDAY
jgi:GNAT acetyltransferase-like protein